MPLQSFVKSSLAILAAISLPGLTATAVALSENSPPAWPATTSTFTNPLDVSIADPFVIREGDTYYMYGTTTNDRPGFSVFTSPDLVRWTRAAKAYVPTGTSWGNHSFWAPEVIKKDGMYYLHYTAFNRAENRRNICVARSESPLGPFTDYAGPLFPGSSIIDSHIYHDPKSNKTYIYASPENTAPSRILGAEISPGLDKLLTTPTACLVSEYGWEDLWIEGPIIQEHNGTLYMIYSGGAYWEADYALGYATATSPLGPWTKAASNPLMQRRGTAEGPGHNGLARSPDGKELFAVYHRHAAPWTVRRVAALDRLVFDKATTGPDILRAPEAPSSSPQPLPSGVKPLRTAASDEFTTGPLNTALWSIYNNNPDNWTMEDGKLVIRAGDNDFWRNHVGGENVFLQEIPTGVTDVIIETRVDMDVKFHNEQAVLTLWYDEDNFVTLAAVMLDGLKFATTCEAYGKSNTSLAPNNLGWPVSLRIEKQDNMVRVMASRDGKNWESAGREVDVSGMTFRAVGLGAWSPGTQRRLPARFDYFRFDAPSEIEKVFTDDSTP